MAAKANYKENIKKIQMPRIKDFSSNKKGFYYFALQYHFTVRFFFFCNSLNRRVSYQNSPYFEKTRISAKSITAVSIKLITTHLTNMDENAGYIIEHEEEFNLLAYA